MLKELRRLKKCLMQNGIKVGMTSGQDPTQLSFQLVGKRRPKEFSVSKNEQKINTAANVLLGAQAPYKGIAVFGSVVHMLLTLPLRRIHE